MIIRNDIDLEGHMIGKKRLDIGGIELHHELTSRISGSYGRQQPVTLHGENLEYFQRRHCT
jgi:hypothetical protein